MRAFTKLREMLSTHEDLRRKVEAMERKYDRRFKVVFDAIKQLIDIESKPKRKIYPVKLISPLSTRLNYENGATTL